jgi:DNA repair exonuclease SbcCD ATPase subunit
MVNSEQIQQMASSFKGAAETMAEVMDRLKAAQEEIKTLNRTVENLSKSNVTLTNTNKKLSEALANNRGGEKNASAGATAKGGKGTNPNSERCPICNMIHGMPFKDFCWELETNKDKRPAEWKSKL